MRSLLIGTMLALGLCSSALATEMQVPQSAKKLTGKEIMALSGSRATFDNREFEGKTLTGIVYYGYQDKLNIGSFNWNNEDKGIFRSKSWVEGDKACSLNPDGKTERCVFLYRDGNKLYDADAKGMVKSVNNVLPREPKLPSGAKKIDAKRILEITKGKRVIVQVFGQGKPMIADVKWDIKMKKTRGTYHFGTKYGKFDTAFVVKDNTLCFPNKSSDNCKIFYETNSGFIELNADGKIHAVSVYQ